MKKGIKFSNSSKFYQSNMTVKLKKIPVMLIALVLGGFIDFVALQSTGASLISFIESNQYNLAVASDLTSFITNIALFLLIAVPLLTWFLVVVRPIYRIYYVVDRFFENREDGKVKDVKGNRKVAHFDGRRAK